MGEGLTQKEMLIRVLDQNEKLIVATTKLVSHADNVDDHLTELNSKVATNVLKIGNLQRDHTQVKAYAVAISAFTGIIITGVNLFFK